MNLNSLFSKKNSAFIILLYLITTSTIAQENTYNQKSEFWKHVRFGGGIGLSFGDGFFSGTLAPSSIYQFNNQFAAGIGLNATYNERKHFYESTVLGGSLIGLYQPIPEIQISTEFEQLHVNRDFDQDYVTNLDSKYWYPALFIGAGYRTNHVTLGVRFDLLYDEYKSFYAEPWMPFVRVYF